MDFKLPIFTEEQAKSPVTFGDMVNLLNEITKSIAYVQELDNKVTEDALQKILNVISDKFADIQYKQIRDARFFINLLSSFGYGSTEYLTKYYTSWCEEFDKINKGVLNDVSKTNC